MIHGFSIWLSNGTNSADINRFWSRTKITITDQPTIIHLLFN